MADLTSAPVLSVCTTVGSKLDDLTVTDGQLIYVRDKHKIAFDFDGKRTIYNQIEELATDAARTSMLAPVTGLYYFVIETATLWTYRDGWVQITNRSSGGGLNITDDGSGNVSITSSGSVSITDDGSGNVTIA